MMKTYWTVSDVKEALDKFLRKNGDSHDGAHYVRPNKTRGPIVEYSLNGAELVFAVDRVDGDWWIASDVWIKVGGKTGMPSLLTGFYFWEVGA